VPKTQIQLPTIDLCSTVFPLGFFNLGVVFAMLLFAQAADGVEVATESASYASGDPIQVTIVNNGPDRISRGGVDCNDSWPLAVEMLQDYGSWQPVQVPQHACIGIAAALINPGESFSKLISLSLGPGTYHVVYAFDDVDNGTQDMSISDPFDVE